MSRTHALSLAFFLLLLVGGAASAQTDAIGIVDRPICEPPISTCEFLPRLSSDLATVWPRDTCPPRYECVCVPSCPECDDCDAQVCVPDPSRECKTACDCPAGLGCFEGQCVAGFAPVYCCESYVCPVGNQCQSGRTGEIRRCDGDASCRKRVEESSRIVARIVEKTNFCEEDRDCARIDTSTQCQGTCGAFVNKGQVERAERRIDYVDKRVCGTYQEDGCPFATPACLAQRPVCRNKRCVGVPILPGPGPRPLPYPIDEVLSDVEFLQELEARH